jgi:hypothetical protein
MSLSFSCSVVASCEGVGVVAVFSLRTFVASVEVDFDDGIHMALVWTKSRRAEYCLLKSRRC